MDWSVVLFLALAWVTVVGIVLWMLEHFDLV